MATHTSLWNLTLWNAFVNVQLHICTLGDPLSIQPGMLHQQQHGAACAHTHTSGQSVHEETMYF